MNHAFIFDKPVVGLRLSLRVELLNGVAQAAQFVAAIGERNLRADY